MAVTLDKSSCDWLRPASFCLLLLRKMSLVPLRRKLTAETGRRQKHDSVLHWQVSGIVTHSAILGYAAVLFHAERQKYTAGQLIPASKHKATSQFVTDCNANKLPH